MTRALAVRDRQLAAPMSRGLATARRAGRGGAMTVLAAAALWGTVGPAQVIADSTARPAALGVLRLLVGGLALAPLAGRRGTWRRLLARDTAGWVVVAAAATGVYQVAFMEAVQRLGAALGTAIALGVAPVATGLCAVAWAGDRLTARWMVGTAICVAGCLAVLRPTGGSRVSVASVILACLAGACYGVYTVAAKRFLRAGAPALAATSATLIVSAVGLSPLLAWNPSGVATVRSLGLIAWIGGAGTALAYGAFVHGLHRTSAATAGTLSLAEPLVAVVLGLAVAGERLTVSGWFGCGLLLAGLAVSAVSRRQAEPTESLDGCVNRRRVVVSEP